MPKVGKKHFKYNKKGIANAKAYAKASGKKLMMSPRMAAKKAMKLGKEMV